MSKTYITKKFSELEFSKVIKHAIFKVNGKQAVCEQSSVVLYEDDEYIPISDIEFSGNCEVISKKVIKSINKSYPEFRFKIKIGSDILDGRTIFNGMSNVVLIDHPVSSVVDGITLSIKLGTKTLDFNLSTEELYPSYIYKININDIDSNLAVGPVMIDGVPLNVYHDVGNNEVNTFYFVNNYLYLCLGTDISKYNDSSISVCIDLNKSPISITAPMTIIPKLVGQSFILKDVNGNIIKSASGNPDLYVAEDSKLYGVGLADIYPGSTNGATASDNGSEPVSDTTLLQLE